MAKVIEKGPRMAPKMLPMRALKGIKNGAQEHHAKITVLWPPGRLLGDSWALFGAPKSEVGFATFWTLEKRGCSWPSWDRLVAILEPSWGHLGSSSGHLGATLGHLEAILVNLRSSLDHLRAVLGPSWHFLSSSGHLGAILGHLGPSWSFMGHL